MPKPSSSNISTKEKLIRAAMELFQSRGYYAIGLNEILKKAAVPKGSLYHHFPDGKEMLAEAAVQWLVNEITEHFDKMARQSTSPVKFVSALFEGTENWLSQHNYRQGALLSVLAQEIEPEDVLLFAAVSKGYVDVIDSLAQALNTTTPNSELAQTILSTLDGAIAMSRATRSTNPIRVTLKTLLPLFE